MWYGDYPSTMLVNHTYLSLSCRLYVSSNKLVIFNTGFSLHVGLALCQSCRDEILPCLLHFSVLYYMVQQTVPSLLTCLPSGATLSYHVVLYLQHTNVFPLLDVTENEEDRNSVEIISETNIHTSNCVKYLFPS